MKQIDSHSRATAIKSGTLVPVEPGIAAEAGFVVPVAMTRAVYEGCVAWTDADTDRTGVPQDERGRQWDVLTMAMRAIEAARPGERARSFIVERVPRLAEVYRPQSVQLVVAIGAGDNREPVITIMQPGEE